MKTLTSNDLAFVASRIPKDVREWMHIHGFAIGGGFVRETIAGEKPNDIDIFGSSKQGMRTALLDLKSLREASGQKCRIHISENADTLLTEGRMNVQCIHRWLYESHVQVVGSFDFTTCAAVIWRNDPERGSEWDSAIHDDFYSDLAAKRLVYTSPQRNEDAGGSLLRVLKFVKRGYNIQPGSLGKVLARLTSAVRWQDISDGTDESRSARVLTGLLREVDPGVVVDGIEPVGSGDDES